MARERKLLALIQPGQKITVDRGFNDVRRAVNENIQILGPAQLEKPQVESAAPSLTINYTFISRTTDEFEFTVYEDDGVTEVGTATAERVRTITVYDPERQATIVIPLDDGSD